MVSLTTQDPREDYGNNSASISGTVCYIMKIAVALKYLRKTLQILRIRKIIVPGNFYVEHVPLVPP